MSIDILKIRYLKPIFALKDEYQQKSIISGIVYFILYIINLFKEIFTTQTELVLLLIIAIIFDWITGVLAAKRNKTLIISLGFRQTIVKTIEYFIFLFIVTGVSNVFGKAEITGWVGDTLKFARNIDWFAYLYIIFTELKSIVENLSGKKGEFRKLLSILTKKFFDEREESNTLKEDDNEKFV